MSAEQFAEVLAPHFGPEGRFAGRYDPPEHDQFQEVAPGGIWQAPVFPVGSNSARLLRVYLIGTSTSDLLRAQWSSEVRALLRLSSAAHSTLPTVREAAMLDQAGLGYLLMDHPGDPLTGASAALRDITQHALTALGQYLRLVEAVATLHRSALLHRSISPHTVCARSVQPVQVVLDGFQLSSFVTSWLRGAAVRRSPGGFLPKDALSRVCLPQERLAPVFGVANRTFESYASDVFSLGMLGMMWFVPNITSIDCTSVFHGGTYSADEHRAVVTAWHDQLRRSALPKPLVSLLEHASSFDRANRPPSAQKVLEALRGAYGALLSEFERADPSATNSRRTVLFMKETAARFYGDGRGRTPPQNLDSEEYAELLSADLDRGVLTWSQTGFRKWADRAERDKTEDAKIVLLGQTYAYFAEYYNQGFPDENRSALLIKYPLELARAPELLRTGSARPLPDIDIRYFEPGVRQRPIPQRQSWDSLLDATRTQGDTPNSAPLMVTARWLLSVLYARLRVQEFACTRLQEDSIVLRGREPKEQDFPGDDRDDAFARLCLQGQLQPMGSLFERAWEEGLAHGAEPTFLYRAARNDREPVMELRFDRLEDEWTVRFRSKASTDSLPTSGFVRLDDRMSRTGYARQQSALEIVGERFPDLVAQLTNPSSLAMPFETQYRANVDDKTLDTVERIRSLWPISIVRGPPGTGKTFLANHVIRAILREDPYARVLVAAQSHHALDNLLEAISEISDTSRALLLRSVSDARKHKVSDIARRFLREEQLAAIRQGVESASASVDSSPQLQKRWKKAVRDRKLDLEFFQRLSRSASVVFATCGSSDARSLGIRGDAEMFDWVIVEEAARAWVTEILVPLVHGIRWMLIGDQSQLQAHQVGEIEQLFHLDLANDVTGGEIAGLDRSHARFLRHFASLMMGAPPRHREDPRIELTVQRRMHPDIGGLVSYAYYDNKLESAAEADRPHGLKLPQELQGRALVWLDTTDLGHPASERGLSNICEAHLLRFAIHYHAQPYLEHPEKIAPLAVLTPYKDQVLPLATALALQQGVIHTIDSFQGRQAEVVLISLVRNNSNGTERSALGFLAEPERANVLFSRARRLLVIAGSLKHFERFPTTHWGRVAEYIRSRQQFLISATTLGFRWDEKERRQ